MVKYPIGKQDFKALREGGYVYVDKTAYIIKLLEGANYYFLSRPRRFGKSLFLSTLEYFYLGKKDLFKGLAIESYDWNWESHPVVHIDLNGTNYREPGSLESRLNAILKEYENKNEISLPSSDNIHERFRILISGIYEKTGLGVVVLVDEYDKPVLDNLDNPELYDKNKEVLRAFYSILKSSDKYLEMVFLTGVTKFGRMNIFSGLNNIRDISLNDEFGAICGITSEELLENFKEGIEDLAKEEETDFDGAVSILKKNYDGYHFSRNCPDVYNPYSLICAFADKEIAAYWSYTGTPSLLARIIKQKNFDLECLEGVIVDKERLMGISNQFEDPVALFYQTGYLTIKSYDKEMGSFTLGYPNKEVEKAFFKYLLPNYSGLNIQTTDSFIHDLDRALEKGNPHLALKILEDFSAGISYDVIPDVEIERHFQYLLYIVCKLLSSKNNFIKVEEKTSDGRIDLFIATTNFIYIMELKKDSDPDKAINQIISKDYALQYRHDHRKVFLIGVNFSTEKKRIYGFKIQTFV